VHATTRGLGFRRLPLPFPAKSWGRLWRFAQLYRSSWRWQVRHENFQLSHYYSKARTPQIEQGFLPCVISHLHRYQPVQAQVEAQYSILNIAQIFNIGNQYSVWAACPAAAILTLRHGNPVPEVKDPGPPNSIPHSQ